MLRFLGVFFAFVTVYYALTLSPWVDANAIFPVLKVSARETSAILKVIGIKTTTEGVVVRGIDHAVAVRRGCDPLEPIVLFSAGVIAFPATWRRKIPGLIVGGAFLFVFNLLRIASLYLLGANKSPLLESAHMVWWPAFFIVCSLILWVLWLRWVQGSGSSLKSVAAVNPRLKAGRA